MLPSLSFFYYHDYYQQLKCVTLIVAPHLFFSTANCFGMDGERREESGIGMLFPFE